MIKMCIRDSCKGHSLLGGTVGAHYMHLGLNAQLPQLLNGRCHHRQIAVRAHKDCNFFHKTVLRLRWRTGCGTGYGKYFFVDITAIILYIRCFFNRKIQKPTRVSTGWLSLLSVNAFVQLTGTDKTGSAVHIRSGNSPVSVKILAIPGAAPGAPPQTEDSFMKKVAVIMGDVYKRQFQIRANINSRSYP